MIAVKEFFENLKENNVDFFTGVPDSLLKDFCSYVTDNTESDKNIITANEGNAVALATGYYLATKKIPLVYMQNSGQGNTINPLTSLADKEVYSIPIILLIGWRGEPGKKDEPQHKKQGKITIKLLETLGIPYKILPENIEEAENVISNAFKWINENNAPFAILVKKDTFEPYNLQKKESIKYELSREDAIKIILDNLEEKDVIVSTTGKTSREVFEYRERLDHGHSKDFLTVGSMGHSSSIALGIALAKPNRNIYCLDGDGALLMHFGALPVIASLNPKNFKHIVLNNGCHDSVGGQPTTAFNIDIPMISKHCGYKNFLKAENPKELKERINILKFSGGPSLLEVRIKKGSRKDLGRPTTSPLENKKAFMDFLND